MIPATMRISQPFYGFRVSSAHAAGLKIYLKEIVQ
jgi:hypothetical protein